MASDMHSTDFGNTDRAVGEVYIKTKNERDYKCSAVPTEQTQSASSA
jgi:hypothetical protein